MTALLLKLLQSIVLVGTSLLLRDGKLALRDGNLVSTDNGTACCCGTPNCTCCNLPVAGILLELTGIINGPPAVYTDPPTTTYCEGCNTLDRNVLVPWIGDCTGYVLFADEDSNFDDPNIPLITDIDCYVDHPEGDPIKLDTYEDGYFQLTWILSCEFDFDTQTYSLKLQVELGYTNFVGYSLLVRWIKEVTGLSEEESKDCSLLNGDIPIDFTVGSNAGDCDFSAAVMTATMVYE